MAIGATAKWEVRTTGNIANGGFYTSGGTDWSQQNGAKYALTGIASVGAGATVLYASASADMVGNGANVVSGTNFTPGRYEVISVVANTSITFGAAVCTGIGVDGVINIGGAVDHPNTISAIVVAGNTIYIAGGTYVKVGANAYVLTASVAGGNGTPVTWIGYTGSRADATGDDRLIFDGDSDADGIGDTTNCLVVSAAGNIFKNIIFSRATGAAASGDLTDYVNCKFSNNGTDALTIGVGKTHYLVNCELSNNADAGCDTTNTGTIRLFGCYIHDNANEGIYRSSTTGGMYLFHSISESNGSAGFYDVGGALMWAINCIAYNNTGKTTDGFKIDGDGTEARNFFYNNIATNNGQYGFNRVDTTCMPIGFFDYNLYNGNGTAGLNNITAGAHDLTSDPLFVDPANGDFTLQAGSPAINTGFPGSWLLRPGAGASFPGTTATSNATAPYDDVDWTNPNNMKASDNTYATATINNNYTYTGVLTKFGFAIPTDATIKGITVKIEAKAATAARVQIPYVKLIKAGSAAGDNKGNTTKLTTGDVVYTFGDTTTMWGNTFTPAQINASNFGVEFACQETSSNATATSIDGVTITVYYDLTRAYKWNIGLDQDDNTVGGGGGTGFFIQ
jgi:hypothetical protein